MLTDQKKAALPYRPCVGSLVVNAEGLIWTGRRIPNEVEYSSETRLWQFPQGGVDKGEDPEPAARRELYEETCIRSVSLIKVLPETLRYDLPEHLIGTALKGKFRGQEQHWFLYRFDGNDSEIDVANPPEGEKPEFESWEWSYLEDAPARAVPFKVELYQRIIELLRGNAAIAWKS